MPSSFTRPLVFQSTDLFFRGRRMYVTTRPLEYRIGSETGEDRIVVPANFLTDLASVPRVGRLFFSPDGPYAPAAVLHDFLYRRPTRPRSECDAIFLEAMTVLQVGCVTRHTLWAAVRLFGRISYDRTVMTNLEAQYHAAAEPETAWDHSI